MGHLVHDKDQVYQVLAQRLNKNPVGAPINDTLMAILHRLYTETEAMVGSKFPLVPMTLEQIAGMTGIKEAQLKTILDGMADKGLVLDIPRKDTFYYMLAPMVVGFFEYTFMRVQDKVKLKDLAELFQSYFNNKEVRDEFSGDGTRMMRTLVYESLIPVAVETEVLTYERASEIIRQSGGGAISICPCRHKAVHLGKSCGAPLEVCTSLGSAAEWIIRRGMGKPATVEELLQVLDQTEKLGLVHNCDNVLNKPAYICHCCGCCCVILSGIKEPGKYATHPSNFFPILEAEACTGCGTCADSCHIRAITMQDDKNGAEVPVVNKDACIGCGVCASACPTGSLTMSRRPELHVPPDNAKEKFLRIAGEKGKI
ncbi:4Fe-4S dicluster domain-containing protein [Desulfotomaculum arcticum]|uniref:4Fe-4S dicluster domain-containing protein n=1 Tax=Desulfotruncus arcticus DSM 17038 TaxID=1121424 RepID=A0A1I2P0I3_9FIRM|nr:4Fe-4S dicluster domain-containing protein [Desulfotruncus arcticus]SFG07246.1 4Fe-4S dicluster domain-containing protein [Desulfotomaculum arcticum] [Desulfotruncus arcticus DSM 17038]